MARPAKDSKTKPFNKRVHSLRERVDGILADTEFASEENRNHLIRKKLAGII
jgi:hypothetical protein